MVAVVWWSGSCLVVSTVGRGGGETVLTLTCGAMFATSASAAEKSDASGCAAASSGDGCVTTAATVPSSRSPIVPADAGAANGWRLGSSVGHCSLTAVANSGAPERARRERMARWRMAAEPTSSTREKIRWHREMTISGSAGDARSAVTNGWLTVTMFHKRMTISCSPSVVEIDEGK